MRVSIYIYLSQRHNKNNFIIILQFLVSEVSAKTRTISRREKNEVPFSRDIGNKKLMHECSRTLTHGNSKNEIRQIHRARR